MSQVNRMPPKITSNASSDEIFPTDPIWNFWIIENVFFFVKEWQSCMLTYLQTIHRSADNHEKGELVRGQHQFKNRYHLSSTVYLYPPQASNFHSVPTIAERGAT
jgi:hypothetical protein